MKRKSIGQAELEVLKYIAESGGTTVRHVADHFAETKGYVRPTVLKMMERLREKGYLSREIEEGVFVYRSVSGKAELDQSLVDQFVQGALDGSVAPMVAYLFRKGSMSKSDLDHLRALVEELDAEEKKQ
jgi:predicted transcriptional regulator